MKKKILILSVSPALHEGHTAADLPVASSTEWSSTLHFSCASALHFILSITERLNQFGHPIDF
jgi:hypothetical protein